MNTPFARCALFAVLFALATTAVIGGKITAAEAPATGPARTAAATRPAERDRGGELAALERKLLGTWQGPACGGDFTFKADGTFDVRSFTPGGNVLTGTWALRWDALPPTLALTFKTSDFKRTYPNEPEYKYVGKTVDAKLLELGDDTLVFRAAGTDWDWRSFGRDKE